MDKKKTNIKERVLQIAKNKGVNYEKFFKSLNVSYSNFKGNQKKSALSSETIAKIISKYPDVDLHWLITGKESNKDQQISENHIKNLKKEELIDSPQSSESIPLISLQTALDFGNNFFHITEKKIMSNYVIPSFKHKQADFLIQIEGHSMHPMHSNGDLIACKILKEHRFLQWNKVHAVVTKNQGILIKRIRQENEKNLKMISDNNDYLPFIVPKDQILGIALVVGVIRSE